jgi:hypothetical protein
MTCRWITPALHVLIASAFAGSFVNAAPMRALDEARWSGDADIMRAQNGPAEQRRRERAEYEQTEMKIKKGRIAEE